VKGDTEVRYGDHVTIESIGTEGEVIEVDTRSVVVRYKKEDGELHEHRAVLRLRVARRSLS